MMEAPVINLFDVGIFTVGEVARLTRISSRRVRRWMSGYTYKTSKGRVRQSPLWYPELAQTEGPLVLSFNEFIEIRAIDKFCEAGVSLTKIRRAIDEFLEEGVSYPFSNRKIITDGSALYSKLIEDGTEMEDERGRPILEELGKKHQLVSYDTILSSIVKNLGFEAELVSYYYPDKDNFPRIVVDPRRAFGHPTILGSRMEVEVVALAYKSKSSIEYVAEWFDIEKESVEEAVSFQKLFYAA